ncbi:MAG TPA: TetR/AcrR family transcriptional regulator [Ilumatobacteraceae bacterium]|nr:TetR/AcrR family transcriptional regulator [Ilumatobacteraceae bacterium]
MTTAIPAVQGARARARAEVRSAILSTASAHVAADGAASLSLRAVARDLGMASSAVYRYFASRDELLTALIIEAYDSLGAHTEAAAAASTDRPPMHRWVTVAMAIRSWAVARPHDFALLYGTPVPGYAAPDDTVAPGIRVSLALISIVADAAGGAGLNEPTDLVISDDTADSLHALSRVVTLPDIGDTTMLAIVLAWTQLFGLLTFELFGQTKNFVGDDELLFRDAATNMARRIGLADH